MAKAKDPAPAETKPTPDTPAAKAKDPAPAEQASRTVFYAVGAVNLDGVDYLGDQELNDDCPKGSIEGALRFGRITDRKPTKPVPPPKVLEAEKKKAEAKKATKKED